MTRTIAKGTMRSHTVRKFRRRLRLYLSDKPSLYWPLAKAINGNFLVSRATELVVEGFPRSGNSYAEAAFRLSQKRQVCLAHHRHAAAQVLCAAKWQIPCVVLIREPFEAIRSLLMHQPALYRLDNAVREYIVFYRAIQPVRKCYVLARFETVTQDFGSVIGALNAHFGTRFLGFDSGYISEAKVFSEIDRLGRLRGTVGRRGEPYSINRSVAERTEREQQKQASKGMLEAEAERHLMRSANRLYTDLASGADV